MSRSAIVCPVCRQTLGWCKPTEARDLPLLRLRPGVHAWVDDAPSELVLIRCRCGHVRSWRGHVALRPFLHLSPLC